MSAKFVFQPYLDVFVNKEYVPTSCVYDCWLLRSMWRVRTWSHCLISCLINWELEISSLTRLKFIKSIFTTDRRSFHCHSHVKAMDRK